ncbi:unnamed protein product [Allacma fusca]|uniref:Uncharacterized protein n=1 Tax=Allacma fusca TaxID=39272 RepID=A0A8J2M621_9HEXA|nr:unnamed protein product [Allacma fusca]
MVHVSRCAFRRLECHQADNSSFSVPNYFKDTKKSYFSCADIQQHSVLLKMMKMRWILLLGLFAVLCLSSTNAEDPKAEPETAAEPEPETTDEDTKKAGATVGKQTKAAGGNPAAAPWALSVPTIFAIACVAKFIL